MKNNIIVRLKNEYGEFKFNEVYNKLNVIQKDLLKLRYLNNNKTLREIAEMFNTTVEEVRRNEILTINKLKKELILFEHKL